MKSAVGRVVSSAPVVACTCIVMVLAGCADDEQPENVGAPGGRSTPAKPTDPSAYKSYVSHDAKEKAVKRRVLHENLDVDVLVKVAYADGKASPTLEDVALQVGDEVEIDVTSDTAGKVTLSGYPDASADVGPGEPEDVEFTAEQQGRITVTLDPAGSTLLTFAVTS